MKLERFFAALATRIASASGQPVTFALALVSILAWAVTGPIFGWSDTWQLIINTGTSLVTFLMVFVIQNSQNRDAAAVQAKLDEIIRALDQARGEFIGIEHMTDRQIEAIRAALEKEAGHEPGKVGTVDDSVETLLKRR